ncbi:MAG TPA: RNA polymerase sigma factor [Nocardioidaceae bacterium]|nr:RNA polymerase sigma factor [Nocardioidaceae bacterium]
MAALERGVAPQPAEEFAAWVEPHLPALARLAGRLVDPADRDDVVQEALLRAWQKRTTYDESRGSPRVWLLAILRDRARRHHLRTPPGPTLAREPVIEQHPSDIDLERALAALSPRQRLAVDLYYFVDLDVATTALVMGCAPGTVKATLSQARARLAELLGLTGETADD